MNKNVNDASLANLKHFEGKWRHGQTRTIRVPIALADRILVLARQLDNGKSLDTSDEALRPTQQKSHNSDIVRSPDTSDIDAADLLNRLKARRKKSKADLADVEAILEMLEG